VVRYRCGWELPVRLLPDQIVRDISPTLRRGIRKRHRLTCEVCGLTPSARLHTSTLHDTD